MERDLLRFAVKSAAESLVGTIVTGELRRMESELSNSYRQSTWDGSAAIDVLAATTVGWSRVESRQVSGGRVPETGADCTNDQEKCSRKCIVCQVCDVGPAQAIWCEDSNEGR
jgi:hypothetical protein